nr:hypothetical protein [uncultured Flavobacterium sp.]
MSKYEKIKILLLSIFIFGFLYCLNNFSENGRYGFTEGSDGYNSLLLVDSRTGEIYNFRTFIKSDLKKYKRVK